MAPANSPEPQPAALHETMRFDRVSEVFAAARHETAPKHGAENGVKDRRYDLSIQTNEPV